MLREMAGVVTTKLDAINGYLQDGSTWNLLQGYAVKSIAAGGLELMKPSSQEYANLFKRSPPKLIDMRPDCYVDLLSWLRGKESLLARLIEHDGLKRALKEHPQAPVFATLGSVHDQVLRRIGHDCLAKQLFLFYYIRKHDRIGDQSDLHEHIDNAIAIIGSQKLDVHFLRRFDLTPDDLIQDGLINSHPVDVLLHFATGDVEARRSIRDAAMDLRNRLQLVGIAHLKGNFENMARTTWLAGQMLSLDTDRARTAARQFQDHLLRVKPGNGTLFESWFAAQPMLMAQMSEFADTEPPCHLWRKHGAFTDLYRALAVRFLANKDHVLDNEGTHARWQWLCEQKRAIKFKQLNANLKLVTYLVRRRDFPSCDILRPYLQLVRNSLRDRATTMLGTPIGHGLRSDALYHERFNLSAEQVVLLKDGRRSNTRSDFFGARSNYYRDLLQPRRFYSFAGIGSNKFLYVADNRTFAGREERATEDALGRDISVQWFEAASLLELHEYVVSPVAVTELGGLSLMSMTVAEIVRAAGAQAEVTPAMDARAEELAYEDIWLDNGLVVYKQEHLGQPDDTGADLWRYKLYDAVDAEEHFWDVSSTHDKVALSRMLSVRDGDNTTWRRHYTKSKSQLAALLAPAAPAAPVPVAAIAPVRGRGRAAGGGRGRARGKARG